MTEPTRCPCCNGIIVLSGYYSGVGWGFIPSFARPFGDPAGVAISNSAHACLSCGHIWSYRSPSEIRRFIQNYTGELGRQFLDEIDRGPYRDLPDTDLAREIGSNIAEIDALAREGNAGKLVRRYRELRGVTWDQAIKETRNWSELKRPAKLALFGWVPKKKESFDDLF